MSIWVAVGERSPKSGEEVLTYFHDKSLGLDQYELLTYFKSGEVMDTTLSPIGNSREERILDTIFNPMNNIIAPVDGFYIYEDCQWKLYIDVITHWQPLTTPK